MRRKALTTNALCLLLTFLHLPMALAESNVVETPATTELSAVQPSVRALDVSKLSVEEKVGQLLFVGIADTDLSERTVRDLKVLQPGAIILFKRNIKSLRQTAELTRSLRKVSREYTSLPLLIATDQEGGRVARIETSPSMPSPLALGMTGDPKIVEAVSFEAGKFLRYLGFNMNLAPVLDVLLENSSSFIGERSFGSSPKLVGELGLAFAQGQLRAGIIPTSKHFPGAGFMTKDPHVESVSIKEDLTRGLAPFRDFVQVFPSAMMLSHSIYPSIDKSGEPATFSTKIISDLLIKELDYKGIIITDDLQMGAAKKENGKIGDLAIRSFKAGADLMMITWGPKEQRKAKEALVQAVQSGQISLADLDQRVLKISKVKNLVAPLIRKPAKIDNENTFESKQLAILDDQILAINMNRELRNIVLPKLGEHFVIVAHSPQFRWGFERSLGRTVSAVDPHEFWKLGPRSEGEKKFLSDYDCVIYPIYSKKEAILLSSVSKEIRKKTLVVNFASPGIVENKSYLGVINLYHPHQNSGKYLGSLIREPASAQTEAQ